MKMTKDVRIHLIGGESIDVDCSSFAGDTLDVFIDSVIYELLGQEYMRINHLVIPAKNVLYVECLEVECDCNVMNSTKHIVLLNAENPDIREKLLADVIEEKKNRFVCSDCQGGTSLTVDGFITAEKVIDDINHRMNLWGPFSL